MTRIALRTTVDAPPDAVWDRLDDLAPMPEYAPFTEGLAYVTPDPAAEGAAWRERNPLGLAPAGDDWRVVESEPPRRRVYEGESTFLRARVTVELRARDGPTRLEQEISYEFLPQLGPAGRALDRLGFRRTLARRGRERLEAFARAVERERDERGA